MNILKTIISVICLIFMLEHFLKMVEKNVVTKQRINFKISDAENILYCRPKNSNKCAKINAFKIAENNTLSCYQKVFINI